MPLILVLALPIALIVLAIVFVMAYSQKQTIELHRELLEEHFLEPGRRCRRIAYSRSVPHHLQSQLFNLAGHPQVARRLVAYERSQRPGRSESYYWNAAIDRLIRDRR